MSRLIKSSKFWSLVIGGIVLALSAIFGWGDEQAEAIIKQVMAVYLAAAPIIYALMTGLEDAFADGVVDLDELVEILKDMIVNGDEDTIKE